MHFSPVMTISHRRFLAQTDAHRVKGRVQSNASDNSLAMRSLLQLKRFSNRKLEPRAEWKCRAAIGDAVEAFRKATEWEAKAERNFMAKWNWRSSHGLIKSQKSSSARETWCGLGFDSTMAPGMSSERKNEKKAGEATWAPMWRNCGAMIFHGERDFNSLKAPSHQSAHDISVCTGILNSMSVIWLQFRCNLASSHPCPQVVVNSSVARLN